ncbi:hypothetical protein FB45DRAFT_1057867 [Roridomyces roridus]|uniref:Uncharacterized protein n=1 Tax=Roridomyces roridus TaxID=1738132 RepID=A0AAD7BWW4_9AGAR|nr:hypothetical protein FB45DRAFT_1057867 [Roridomyces roridus]
MSLPQLPTSGPSLYRYVVIGAAVLVPIVVVAAYFRARHEKRRARRRRLLAAEHDEARGEDRGGREPRLFDAYLHDGRAPQWEDMMPLSAENLGAIPADKEGFDTMRVNVGVIVRMPVPLSQLQEDPPPYVELGVVEMLRPVYL